MTIEEAMYILRNAAFLGTNEERERMERAVEVIGDQIEHLKDENRRMDRGIAGLQGEITGMRKTLRIVFVETK